MPYQIYLSPPHTTGNELNSLKQVIDQNWMAPAGPFLEAFESNMEAFVGKGYYATALQSGTAAIHLGLKLLGVSKGDVVLCQSLTFVASINPVTYLGATPVFIDSESDTWNLCPILLEEAIKDHLALGIKPKAIIAVHLYGMPYQVAEIHRLANKYEIPVLEDSAEALGSTYNNIPCGSFGNCSVYSFNGNKIITTGGGGALITKSKTQKDYALKLASQAKEGKPYFEHCELGYNYTMSSFNAAVGLAQFKALDEFVNIRRRNFEYYKSHLEAANGCSFLTEPKSFFSNRWLSVLITSGMEQRERIRKRLEKAQIESRPVWKPMHQQPLFKNQKSYLNGVSDAIFEKGLCLPSGSQLTEEQLNLIISIVKAAK